jgi:hypothetical protein
MVRGGFVIVTLVMLRRFAVVMCCLFVMFSCAMMVVARRVLAGHAFPPLMMTAAVNGSGFTTRQPLYEANMSGSIAEIIFKWRGWRPGNAKNGVDRRDKTITEKAYLRHIYRRHANRSASLLR